MLKCSENDAGKQLHSLFNSIWKDQCASEDWKKSRIVKVPKKGDLSECDNYRGISLLSVPSKILCRVLTDRLKSGVDEMMRQEQAGFRSGRGTSDQIFALRNILEQYMKTILPVCDTYKAFYFIASLFSSALFLGVVAISVDRFLATHLHLRYQELVTQGRVLLR